jgi:hypothetical protein
MDETAEIVGIGRAARSRNVPLNLAKNAFVLFATTVVSQACVAYINQKVTHSSFVICSLSFKSAPAQKAESALLPMTSARVGPFPPSAAIDWTCWDSEVRRFLDRAFRALGRLRRRTRMLPVPGAGTYWV